MRRPLIAGPTTLATTTTMPPRCLDVWIPFLPRWLKTPLLSQQRSQSCIFRGAGAGAEIVHGDLSTRAGIVSSFFCPNNAFAPLVQLVACQLSIIYRGVGGGHSKNTPDHTLQIQGGAEFIAPSGIQDVIAVFYRFCCWSRVHVLLSVQTKWVPYQNQGIVGSFYICSFSFFRSLINYHPGIIFVEQGTDDWGWLDVPQEGRDWTN